MSTVYTAAQIRDMLEDSRRRTLEVLADLSDEQMQIPELDIVNPPIWEMGHVAWFQEKWALRHLRGRDSLHPKADEFWDSAAVSHHSRWELPLPSRAGTLRYMADVLDGVLEALPDGDLSEDEAYFHWLAAMHEDMHGEALAYTRQTLGYPLPPGWRAAAETAPEPAAGDVAVEGGNYQVGAEPGQRFVFDNEKWAHEVRIEPFAIARCAVTNGQFASFVDDGGYRRREFWSDEGWRWREREQAGHPVYWVRGAGGGWQQRFYDRVQALAPDEALIHVNWYEAEAWCRWARRRLPSEAEWELAASGYGKCPYPWGAQPPRPEHAHLDGSAAGCLPAAARSAGESPFGCRQMLGNVWEWTATDFGPYPGFEIDPYKEYSAPWFGSQRKVLRGGCWATRSRLIRNTWRNYFTKDRRDIFAGFRTCAR